MRIKVGHPAKIKPIPRKENRLDISIPYPSIGLDHMIGVGILVQVFLIGMLTAFNLMV